MMLYHFLLVGIGGFFGAISRHKVSSWLNKKGTSAFPYGTITVNLLGSYLLGIIVGTNWDQSWQLFLGTGFMGAFTTFSTFKLENIQMHFAQRWPVLISYITLSYGGGILLAFLGMLVGMKH